MSTFASPPITPYSLTVDQAAGTILPAGPTLMRRLSDLEGLFRDQEAWRDDVGAGDRLVYTVASSPVPEVDRELPQSITTIQPGTCGGEFYMTKGHQHPNHQGEIYLGLSGTGGLILYDGERFDWVEMAPGVMGYIPAGWAHRSVNVGDEPYSFLAVYPGCAGHDYGWVLEHGLGKRVVKGAGGYELRPYFD